MLKVCKRFRSYAGSNTSAPKVFPNYKHVCDLRSDTVTRPTAEMFTTNSLHFDGMGDDVYGEDRYVCELESVVSKLCGHEAGLFCASGTMTNQLALRVHLGALQSVIMDTRAHVHKYECGGVGFHSQAQVLTVTGSKKFSKGEDDPATYYNTFLSLSQIQDAVIPDDGDIHSSPTRVICLENTMNGSIYPFDELERISKYARKNNLIMHLDGARLWNASAETGISLSSYGSLFDTMSLCLSKGMGAPIGSMLVGPKHIIQRARHFRKAFGGGWRQAGILAKPILDYCLPTIYPKLLRQDHENTRYLASELKSLNFTILNESSAITNMLFIDARELLEARGKSLLDLGTFLRSGDGMSFWIAVYESDPFTTRLVLHYQIKREHLEELISRIKEYLQS